MNFEELLQSALTSDGLIVQSRNRIALRSFLLREITKSVNADIRNLVVEYSPANPHELLILKREKAQELFNERSKA